MNKIIAFTGSNSSKSINEQLLKVAIEEMKEFEVEHIDLTKYELPIFSVDIEANGMPENVLSLADKLKEADGFVIATPEHNGSTTAFFKNTMDWLSRVDRKYLGDQTPVLLLSASPGPGGAAGAANELSKKFGYVGGDVVAAFSLASFFDNFDSNELAITNVDKKTEFNQAVGSFKERFVVKA